MKLLTVFLLALMLFLIGQPVCAVPAGDAGATPCCTEGTTEACGDEEDAENSSPESGGCKGCNPFQACACCVACASLPTPLWLAARPLFSQPAAVRPCANEQALISADAPGFWQPPRRA